MGRWDSSVPWNVISMGYASLILPPEIDVDVCDFVEMADPTRLKMKASLRLGGVLGFVGGFLMAYQRSSCEFTHLITSLVSYVCAETKSDSGAGQKTNGKKRWTWLN